MYFERIKVSFDCGNILDFLHLAEFCVAFYEKKTNKKNRPPDLEKLKWVDAKQVIFFMWP